MGHMDPLSCDECRAIYRELRDVAAAMKEHQADQNIGPQNISAWVQQLDEDECARMRETSSLWKTWRRLQQHRALTGHSLSFLPSPPNAISNPN
jgi:hypothetical protein